MNPNTGGQYSDERQRQTAAEIARKKVLSAYSSSSVFSAQVQNQQAQAAQPQNTGTYKNASVNATVSNQDLQKYHSAWQNYYQKYYNDYYAKAAKQYIETEKLKAERAKNDENRQ